MENEMKTQKNSGEEKYEIIREKKRKCENSKKNLLKRNFLRKRNETN